MDTSVPSWAYEANKVEYWAEAHQGGTHVMTLEILDGSVTGEMGQGTRWSFNLTVAGIDAMVPTTPWTGSDRDYGDDDYGDGIYGDARYQYYRGLLLPIKTQIQVKCQYLDGASSHTLTMGTFTIRDLKFTDAPGDATVSISGTDYTDDFAKILWTAPFKIAKNTNLRTAILDLVDSVNTGIGGTGNDFTATCPTTSRILRRKRVYMPGAGLNPWTELDKLAGLKGWQPHFNRSGGLVVDEPPDPETDTAVWSFSDTTNIQKATLEPQGSEVLNTVILVAKSASESEPPLYLVKSRTDGTYGTSTTTGIGIRRAVEEQLDGVEDLAEAEEVALKMLRQRLRWTEVVALETHPCEWLEPGDVVTVSDDYLELSPTDKYAIERITHPLRPDAPAQVQLSRRLG